MIWKVGGLVCPSPRRNVLWPWKGCGFTAARSVLRSPFSVLRGASAPHMHLCQRPIIRLPKSQNHPISQHTIRHPQALSFGKSLVLLEGLRLIPYMMSDKARNGRRRARSAAKPPSNQLISRMLHWSTHVFAIPIFLGQYCRFPFFWAATPPFCYTVG